MNTATPSSAYSTDAGSLLTLLLHRTAVLSIAQVVRAGYGAEAVDRTIASLQRLKLVEVSRSTAHPLLDLRQPLAAWQPALPPIDCHWVSRIARSRFSQPEATVDVVVATAEAAAQFGGHPGKVAEGQLSHDLHVSSLYLQMRKELPTRARSWRCEASLTATLGKRGEPLPDALVRDGRSLTAIEFAGASYGPGRIAELFEYCQYKAFGLEIW